MCWSGKTTPRDDEQRALAAARKLNGPHSPARNYSQHSVAAWRPSVVTTPSYVSLLTFKCIVTWGPNNCSLIWSSRALSVRTRRFERPEFQSRRAIPVTPFSKRSPRSLATRSNSASPLFMAAAKSVKRKVRGSISWIASKRRFLLIPNLLVESVWAAWTRLRSFFHRLCTLPFQLRRLLSAFMNAG